jgi:polyphosphate kinase
MTCLRPQVPGLSENITVRSIVGKFLEHSRIYRFGSPGEAAVYYIGSADMMPRNLDGRVETLTPVIDARLKLRLEEIIQVNLADDELAWELDGDATWSRVAPDRGVNAMETFQDLALARSRPETASA